MQQARLPDESTMYSAVVDKDSRFEGIFVFAVKTTGIFCRPTCTARIPKSENVEYFPSVSDALAYGYRPCKVCHPLEPYGEPPNWLQQLMAEIDENPGIRLRDADLRARDIDPARIRRWFKKHHGMTFQAFLRSIRINQAFGQIRRSGGVTRSALDSGYDSLSGFNEAFKKATGFTPSASKGGQVVTYTRILTPLGPMFAGATEEGICLLEFNDRKMLQSQVERLQKLLRAEFIQGRNRHLENLEQQLDAYFDGTLKVFDLPLLLPGTDFQKSAWRALQSIPYADTRSYQDQARAIGNPKSVRAVAKANGDNRIAIVIPCHRVIAKNGDLTGYAGGLWRKRYLLELERENSGN